MLQMGRIIKIKFKFHPIFVADDWDKGANLPNTLILNLGRKKIPKEIFVKCVRQFEKDWKVKILDKIESSQIIKILNQQK